MTERLNSSSLQEVRKARKLSRQEVSSFTKISAKSLERFEAGDAQPTFKQLQKLADLYNIALHNFFLPKLPKFESTLPDFRKSNPTQANLSPRGLSRLWEVERRAIFADEVSEALGAGAPKIENIKRLTNKVVPEPAELRAAFDNWLESRDKSLKFTGSAEDNFSRYLRLFLETRGCQTVFNSAPTDDYLGFYTSLSRKNNVVFVNRDMKNEKRRLFTLSHELAHFLSEEEGVSDPFVAKNDIERRCNSFAASFLAPDHQILKIIESTTTAILGDPLRLVNLLARMTLLSRQASVLRLEELDVISKRQRSDVFKYLRGLTRVVEQPSEPATGIPMGRQAAVGKKLSEVGVLAAYTAHKALSANLIDSIDIERGLGISEKLQKDVLDLAARRFEASAA